MTLEPAPSCRCRDIDRLLEKLKRLSALSEKAEYLGEPMCPDRVRVHVRDGQAGIAEIASRLEASRALFLPEADPLYRDGILAEYIKRNPHRYKAVYWLPFAGSVLNTIVTALPADSRSRCGDWTEGGSPCGDEDNNKDERLCGDGNPYGDGDNKDEHPCGDGDNKDERPCGDGNNKDENSYGDENPYGDRDNRGGNPCGDGNNNDENSYGDENPYCTMSPEAVYGFKLRLLYEHGPDTLLVLDGYESNGVSSPSPWESDRHLKDLTHGPGAFHVIVVTKTSGS
jgi:hypothetical protein